eukprot:TRINITY_DN1606_c0_g1_i1.p1 TRINITY_DN1606_c0_g1~~TRINITY_DN1606_c0_g1_i1.p1  ORF type:complete len:845 (+),score=307.25 TRINITY_DN1606_c0_g1_i1:109-2535(+)
MSVIDGPGISCVCVSQVVQTREALILSEKEYALVRNIEDGTLRIINGPSKSFLTAHEEVHKRETKTSLGRRQYCIISHQVTGDVRLVEGPCLVSIEVHEVVGTVQDKPSLSEEEYAVIEDRTTGLRRAEYGPAIVTISAYEEAKEVKRLPILKTGQYLRVTNVKTGTVKIVIGPDVYKPSPYDSLGKIEDLPVLSRGEYCRLHNQETGLIRIAVGPAVVDLGPHEKVVEKAKLPVLEVGEYCVVKNTENGDKRMVTGPCIVELGVFDVALEIMKMPVVAQAEYCRIRNHEEGTVRVVNGPCIAELGPYDEVSVPPTKLPVLNKDEYVRIINEETGAVTTVFGPIVAQLGPYDTAEEVLKCPDLSADEYIVVRNEEDGSLRNIEGPLLFQPGPFDVFDKPKKVVNLRKNEYIRLRDDSGVVRVVRGEKRLIPAPLELMLDNGVQHAINIDNHHAVLVRNTENGSLELLTNHGLFFPTPYQEIVKVQEKIVLEKYQTVVCKDATGAFYYASGDTDLPQSERGPGPDFFLPPHHEIVKHSWSTDLKKEHLTSEMVWKFDSRPSYMNYEFFCRTLDNVSLVIDVTFFWRIIDVKAMVESTADAPGDTCTHARSMIMQEISKIKLMDFLESFNSVIRNACLNDDFYGKRGVELLSVEVLKFECQSDETNRILQEMIKETCDRLKYKERQRGENEVSMARLEGEIAEEKRREELVEVRKSHMKTEARIEGEAEGARIGAFITKLASTKTEDGSTMGFERAMRVYETQKQLSYKLDSVTALAQGNAQLYLLPEDVNLNLGTLDNPTLRKRGLVTG